MRKLVLVLAIGVLFTSCEKVELEECKIGIVVLNQWGANYEYIPNLDIVIIDMKNNCSGNIVRKYFKADQFLSNDTKLGDVHTFSTSW